MMGFESIKIVNLSAFRLICKYSIIEFEDGSIEIIPKTWFLDEAHTYFPNNTKDRIKYDRSVLKMDEPHPEWEVFSITKIIASEGKQNLPNISDSLMFFFLFYVKNIF